MKILIHDYSGHPFQVQLSKALARRHHQVLHLYSGSFQTPRGSVGKLDSDPKTFDCLPIYLSKPFAKYSFIKRRFQEIEYGRLLYKEVEKYKPDVLVSSNTPLDPQKILLNNCKRDNIKFVFWLQDLYGTAIQKILSEKYSFFGKFIGSYYRWLEFSMLRKSDRVVTITEDFLPILATTNVPQDKIYVVHNWAPLDELPLHPKDNDWAKEHGIHDKLCILYSGTLGLKHNPELILELAVQLKDQDEVRIVVVSEGLGADFLQQKKMELNLKNLVLFKFQPFEIFPKILATADILVAILEKEAGIFSVPSKVLTYHCAGRALLLAVPPDNHVARIVQRNRTGIIVSPDDKKEFLKAAQKLLQDAELRTFYGENARQYAENTFDIEKIADKFEEIITYYSVQKIG